jgi:hypothetical protein
MYSGYLHLTGKYFVSPFEAHLRDTASLFATSWQFNEVVQAYKCLKIYKHKSICNF